MVRPIFEPNTNREVAAAQFATQQLFRRPAPVAATTALVPAFIAIQDSHFTTAVDGNDTVLLWDVWDITDTTVFDAVAFTGGLLNSVTLLKEGSYTLTCGVEWALNWNATMRIILASDYDFNKEMSFVGRAGGWTGDPTATFSLIFPAPFEPLPGTLNVQFQVEQESGVTRDTDLGTFMQIIYNGPIPTSASS